MTWYRLSLVGDVEEINQVAWQSAWEASQSKELIDHSSAIFGKVAGGKGLTLYFTPSSQLLAKTFGATPCSKPWPFGLSLFAGDNRAWRIHFVLMSWKRFADKVAIDGHPPKPVESIWPSQFR